MRSTSPRVLIGCALLITVGLLAHAGQLSPPAGAVAPTMKTLDEISTQIAGIQAGSGGVPVKRVVRGVIDFAVDQKENSQVFSPTIDPAKSTVVLSPFCFTDTPLSNAPWAARTGSCLIGLTGTQITVRVDASIALQAGKVSYQIIEYY